MTILQKPCTKFEKKFENGEEITTICTTGVPLGDFHDYVMELKGWSVDRMIKAHQEDQEHAEIQKKNDCLEGGCDGS